MSRTAKCAICLVPTLLLGVPTYFFVLVMICHPCIGPEYPEPFDAAWTFVFLNA